MGCWVSHMKKAGFLMTQNIVEILFLFQKVGPKMLDHEGKEVPGNRGYK